MICEVPHFVRDDSMFTHCVTMLRSRFESHPRSGLLVCRSSQARALRSVDEFLARCRNNAGAHGLGRTTLSRPLLPASSQNPAPPTDAFLSPVNCAGPA